MPQTTRARRPRAARLTARTADRYALYQKAVQVPDADVAFVERVFGKLRGRKPLSLREDFCGTALLASTWVASRPDRTAIGVDVDTKPLTWGREHNVLPLGEAAKRIELVHADVRTVRNKRVDVVVAGNFSFYCFDARAEMLAYFRNVRQGLRRDGLFVLDAFGGPESHVTMTETTRKAGFKYLWEQATFEPVSQRMVNYIGFEFPDGTAVRRAFRYDWRVWGLREIQDVLADAGFARVRIYWEGFNADGRGNGIYREVKRADECESFVCTLVAEP